MKEHIIKQLRDCAVVKNKQRTWISELSDDQIYQIFLKIRGGESAASIARCCQQSWGIKENSTIHSLKQGILKFQKRIAHLLLPISIQPHAHNSIPCEDRPNYLEGLEYNELIAAQLRKRIKRMMNEEEELNFAYNNLNKDIQALTTLEKAIIKQREWALKHQGEDPIEIIKERKKQEKIKNNFDGLMNRITDDGRERIVESLNNFMEECGKNASVLKIDDNGNYTVLSAKSEKEKLD